MPAYHYIALNQEGKELSGVIEAVDEQLARKKLNNLSMSVVSLEALSAESVSTGAVVASAAQAGKNIFEFEARDNQGKKVVGTIAAENEVKAFGRLFDEYQLNVLSIVNSILGIEEKEKAKGNIVAIQQEYERLYGSSRKAREKEAEMKTASMQETRQELLIKVDATMRRIESFLQESGEDLKPEERDTIKSYLNQLIRIKDSTNLEHILTTCEKMLEHLQRQELFIHEERKLKESARLKVDTKDLLSQLKQTGLSKELSIVGLAMQWQQKPLLRPLANILLRWFKPKTPEIQKVSDDIRTINRHIWEYVKLIFTGKSKTMKFEAWDGIKTLREEKKRLALQLKALEIEEQGKADALREPATTWEQTGSVLGWVMAFYLIAYVVSYPFTIKIFPISPLPKNFFFYESTITKGVTLALFLAYGAVTIRNFWLKKYDLAPYLLYPVTLFGFLLIVINLM